MANLDFAPLGAVGALGEAEIDGNNLRIVFQNREAFEELSDNQFIKIYWLSKPLATELIDLLELNLRHPTRLSALDIETQVLTELGFFAAGSYQTDVGHSVMHMGFPNHQLVVLLMKSPMHLTDLRF